MRRRTFIQQLAALPLIPFPRQAPAIITSEAARPILDAGVSAGPWGRDGAIVWGHADRPARLTVEYSTTSSFTNARRVRGSIATPGTGLTARALIGNLPAGQDVFYRVRLEDAVNDTPQRAAGRTLDVAARDGRSPSRDRGCMRQGWG